MGTWLGKRFRTKQHIVARKEDGLVIRAVKLMPEVTTVAGFERNQGLSVGPSAVLKDVLPDAPRPILSRDDPPFVPDEKRPAS